MLGLTRDLRAIPVLVRFLEKFESLDYQRSLFGAIKAIGALAEPILVEELRNSSNLNVMMLLALVLGHLRSTSALPELLSIFRSTENLGLKSALFRALSAYQSKKICELLSKSFKNSNSFEKTLYLPFLAEYPCKEYEDLIFSLTKDKTVHLETLVITKMLSKTATVETIDPLLDAFRTDSVLTTAVLQAISKKFPDAQDKVTAAFNTTYPDDPKRQITELLHIRSEQSANQILRLIEENAFYSAKEVIYRLILFEKIALRPFLEALKRTKEIKYTIELIRAIGLLGLGIALEDFLECTEPYLSDAKTMNTLFPYLTWAVVRMSLRNPSRLADLILEDTSKHNPLLISAMNSLKSREFIRPLRQHRDEFLDSREEFFIISALLACGDQQIIGRALAILDKEQNKDLRYLMIGNLKLIDDPESRDYLAKRMKAASKEERELITLVLIGLKDKRAVPYLIKLLEKDKLKLDLKSLSALTLKLPYVEVVDGILTIAEKVRKEAIHKFLGGIFPGEAVDKLLKEFRCLADIPFTEVNDDQQQQISVFLRENQIHDGRGFTFKTKRSAHTKMLSVHQALFFPTLEQVIHHAGTLVVENLTGIANTLHNIAEHDSSTFFD
ncbi:MAG: HEAT repeat domain-containing protein, partial [Candidatus Hodarchaeales archaeon]